jgi:hypothetical protein
MTVESSTTTSACIVLQSSRTDYQPLHSALSFYSAATSTGITIPYPLITLHAISRAPLRSLSANSTETVGGGPCIYCQIDESEGADDEGDEDNTREVIIIPTNAESREFPSPIPPRIP